MSDEHKSDEYKVAISEPFDFALHEEFRAKLDSAISSGSKEIVIDLSFVIHMDSSALGMLIIANKNASAQGAKIKIIGVSADIYEMLQLTQIDKMFEIELK
jgi:anti-anti-sigma factor